MLFALSRLNTFDTTCGRTTSRSVRRRRVLCWSVTKFARTCTVPVQCAFCVLQYEYQRITGVWIRTVPVERERAVAGTSGERGARHNNYYRTGTGRHNPATHTDGIQVPVFVARLCTCTVKNGMPSCNEERCHGRTRSYACTVERIPVQ